ncbi:MAG: 2-oxo acid dehydrogenase subunit E2 [bacterium]|nr:2-oxo acid dehydrogenase subunit E2 [Gammaproteobacteria bacterium]HIL98838.1 2-oxo acid dehydrogenase subunit E2 [Pseudomonadales bacterium]
MPKEIYLVKVGMTMTEGMVSEWYIPDGEQVRKGEMLYALETEKINMDIDAEASGTVKHLVEIGVNLEPGTVVGFVFEEGEDIPSNLSVAPASTAPATIEAEVGPSETVEPQKSQMRKPDDGRIKSSPAARRLAKELGLDYLSVTGTGPGGRIVEADVQAAKDDVPQPVAPQPIRAAAKASPLAKRLAREKGVDINQVIGSGPGGRIVQADIDAAAQKGAAPQTVVPQATDAAPGSIKITGMRKTIARRMFSSLQNSAQLTMDMEADMDDGVKLRESLIEEWKDEGIRPTYTDLVIRAVAKALVRHPLMNSQFGETEITLLPDVHMGIAVALPEGLVVPVVRHADRLSLKEIAVESSRLALAAREGTLGLDDYAEGSFTITALGMYGVDSFTPIINEPQAGILGINRIFDGVNWRGDTPVKCKKMNLSLTWDHRVIDGAPAAEFLVEVRELLANPYRLLV